MQITTWLSQPYRKHLGQLIHQGYTNPGSHVTMASKFCTVTPNIFVLNMEFSLCDPSDASELIGGL